MFNIITHQGIKIKTTMRYHYTHNRITTFKNKSQCPKLARMENLWIIIHCYGNIKWYKPSENVWQFLINYIKLIMFLIKLVKLSYPRSCILGHLYLRGNNLYSQQAILGRQQKKEAPGTCPHLNNNCTGKIYQM